MKTTWGVDGYDTFEEEYYPLGDGYLNEEQTRSAAAEKLRAIQETQSGAGGQGHEGIQDHVFIVQPDGTRIRFVPLPPG